jgi:hypothetical protein
MKNIKVLLLGLLISSQVVANEISIKSVDSLTDIQQQVLEINESTQNSWVWWLNNQMPTDKPSLKITDPLYGHDIPFEAITVNNANCYVLMVDSSLSMKPYWKDVISSMELAAETVGSNLAVFRFAESPQEVIAFNSGSDQVATKQGIATISPQGKDTQLYLALNAVLKQINNCPVPRQHLIVFSDGDAEDKAITLREVVDVARDKQVAIHSVGFGDLSKSKTALKLQVLDTLSDKTSGFYHHFTDMPTYNDFLKELTKKNSIMGTLKVDSKLLPFGNDTLNIMIKWTLENGEIKQAEVNTKVNNTEQWKNVLVTVQLSTGVKNPLWVVYGVVLILLLTVLLVFLIKYKKNKYLKEVEQQAINDKEAEKQAIFKRDEEMKAAIDAVHQKIEEFQPDQNVNSHGDPYAWLLDSNGNYYALMTYSTTVGRDSENSIVLQDPTVSRSHAILDYKNGQMVWTDRAPSNSTLINSQKVNGSHSLLPNDSIQCGQVRLVLKLTKD